MLSRINFRVIQEYVGKKLREGSVHIYGNCGNGPTQIIPRELNLVRVTGWGDRIRTVVGFRKYVISTRS